MSTTYRLNANELDHGFLDTLKSLFKDKEIEIVVTEAEQNGEDETEYLLKSPANRERLLAAIENIAQGRNLVTVKLDELQ